MSRHIQDQADTIFVVSLPHTGTVFVYELLNRQAKIVHYWKNSKDEARQKAATRRTIVPLRHPLEVAQSWKSSELLGKARHMNLSILAGLWAGFIEHIDPLDPCYLPLDVPDRQDYLDTINERFDLALTTDWPVIGHQQFGDVPLTGKEKADVLEQVEELSGFFGRFYQ